MWPGRPYEEGCDEPFVIRFSDDDFVFFHLCIARDIDELGDVMQRAAFLLGGQEVNLIALIGDDKRVCFALDFGKHAEKECPAVQIRFQRAWVDLLGVYLEWLRGRNVNIVAYLESEYGARLGRQPTGTFDEIKEEQSVRTARLRDWMRQAVVLQPNDPQRAMKLLKFQMGRVRVAAQKAAVNVCPRPVASLTLGMCFADVSNFVTDPRFRCLTKPELMGMVSSVAARMAEVGAHYEMSMAKTAKEVYEDLGQFVLGNRWDDILPPMQRLDVCEGVLMRDTRTRSTVQNWVQKIRTELEGRRRGIEEDLP
ncbi:hypothetical protein F4779DRAFT_597521 [Xylariaceae sp. FL0662B]|nr:hypothetical protein F4779DRAFT_597521 [Xylariaceae sp. FL0662B]